jgi:hypothetical protein
VYPNSNHQNQYAPFSTSCCSSHLQARFGGILGDIAGPKATFTCSPMGLIRRNLGVCLGEERAQHRPNRSLNRFIRSHYILVVLWVVCNPLGVLAPTSVWSRHSLASTLSNHPWRLYVFFGHAPPVVPCTHHVLLSLRSPIFHITAIDHGNHRRSDADLLTTLFLGTTAGWTTGCRMKTSSQSSLSGLYVPIPQSRLGNNLGSQYRISSYIRRRSHTWAHTHPL